MKSRTGKGQRFYPSRKLTSYPDPSHDAGRRYKLLGTTKVTTLSTFLCVGSPSPNSHRWQEEGQVDCMKGEFRWPTSFIIFASRRHFSLFRGCLRYTYPWKMDSPEKGIFSSEDVQKCKKPKDNCLPTNNTTFYTTSTINTKHTGQEKTNEWNGI